MTSQLKIRCLLKTTAKKLWTRQRVEEKKSCFEKGGGRGVCNRKSELVTEGKRGMISLLWWRVMSFLVWGPLLMWFCLLRAGLGQNQMIRPTDSQTGKSTGAYFQALYANSHISCTHTNLTQNNLGHIGLFQTSQPGSPHQKMSSFLSFRGR